MQSESKFLRVETDIIKGVRSLLELIKVGAIENYNSKLRLKERGTAKEHVISQNEIFYEVFSITCAVCDLSSLINHRTIFDNCNKVVQNSVTLKDFDGAILKCLNLCASFKIYNSIILSLFENSFKWN